MLETSSQSDEPLGLDQEDKPVYLKRMGRYGPYVQRGSSDDDEKPQYASVPKGMNLDEVTLEKALSCFRCHERWGPTRKAASQFWHTMESMDPNISCGDDDKKETRSLPAGVTPFDVTFEQAMELASSTQSRRSRTRC